MTVLLTPPYSMVSVMPDKYSTMVSLIPDKYSTIPNISKLNDVIVINSINDKIHINEMNNRINSIIINDNHLTNRYVSLVPSIYNNYLNQMSGIYTPDLNNDTTLQRGIINKIWELLIKEWMYDFTKIFKFIKKSSNGYELVDTLVEMEKNNIDTSHIEDKIAWFVKHIYKKSNLAATLEKYRERTQYNWWEITENKYDEIKEFCYHQMKRLLLKEYNS